MIISENKLAQMVFKSINEWKHVNDTSVMILGESGTGKGILARAIHGQSNRKEYPFITFSCSAHPLLFERHPLLFESELFGHEKGAFAGANKLKRGIFEKANGGTVFFDEIGKMEKQLQTKLYRILEKREYERVGGTETLTANVRILAATSANLELEKSFRGDLYYKLSCIKIKLPPLRERKGDIPNFAQFFLHKFNVQYKRILEFDNESMSVLQEYDYPENIRELKNIIEVAVIRAKGEAINVSDLPDKIKHRDREYRTNNPIEYCYEKQSLSLEPIFPEGGFTSSEPKIKNTKKSETMRVEFSVFVPKNINPKSSFLLDIWAYLPTDYQFVCSRAKELDRDLNIGLKKGVPVTSGSTLTVTIEIPLFKVLDPIDTIIWQGEPTNTSFIVEVPGNLCAGTYPGKANVLVNGLCIAKIQFLISLFSSSDQKYINSSVKQSYVHSAFASYASENREEVLYRIQGMKKVVPDLDIFTDILSLRSGQNWKEELRKHVPTKDTFFLFWSQFAARSVWVEREWKLALHGRGLDYIDPIPLEEPDIAPPPRELSTLHFSDVYLAHINHQRMKKEIKTMKKGEVSLLENDKKPTISKIKFVSIPRKNLSDIDVKNMIKQHNFFCRDDDGDAYVYCNPDGYGIQNKFELLECGRVVYDHASGLMWQLSGSDALNFTAAKVYLNQLKGFAGYNDWRLPTLEEAMSLLVPTKNNNLLYTNSIFENQSWIWTSDLYSPTDAWAVSFYLGYCVCRKFYNGSGYVRAVR